MRRNVKYLLEMANSMLRHTTNGAIEASREHALFGADTPLLLMVSGGSDSTALAYIFKELQDEGYILNLAALHVNHKIRGVEADADQEFVRELCEFLEIPLFEAEVDIPKIAASSGENLEACARRERYVCANDALCSLCNHVGANSEDGRIVTAHTLDDRVENFYMRSIVGTGPGGFRSMRFQTNNVTRPLMRLTREELQGTILELNDAKLAYANSHGQLWREDATNKDESGFRAFVRHTLIPQVKRKNVNYAHTLEKTMDLIADEDDMLELFARELLQENVTLYIEENRAEICPAFAKVKVPIQRRAAFKLLGAMMPESVRVENASVEAVLAPFESGECKHVRPKNIQCNLMVTSNKNGVIVESAESYRAKRKRM